MKKVLFKKNPFIRRLIGLDSSSESATSKCDYTGSYNTGEDVVGNNYIVSGQTIDGVETGGSTFPLDDLPVASNTLKGDLLFYNDCTCDSVEITITGGGQIINISILGANKVINSIQLYDFVGNHPANLILTPSNCV